MNVSRRRHRHRHIRDSGDQWQWSAIHNPSKFHTHTVTRVLQQWPSNYSHVKCILVHGRPRIVWHAEHNTHHISASTGSPTPHPPPPFGTKMGRPRALMTAPSARDSANNMKRGRECSSARVNARILWHRMLQCCPRVCCNFATQYPH